MRRRHLFGIVLLTLGIQPGSAVPPGAANDAPTSTSPMADAAGDGPFPAGTGLAPTPLLPGDGWVHVKLEGTVDAGMAPLVERALRTAREQGASGVLLDVDTLGGRLDAGIRIRDALLASDVPVTCWVDSRAISAGALICLAAGTIDMAPGSTIGAATPITLDASGEMKPVEAKVTSYVRKEFAATAEARHRRRDVAEAMVDGDVIIAGIAEKGPLTLSTDEALSLGLAARSSASAEQAAQASGMRGSEATLEMGWAEKAARAVTHPVIAGLLLAIAGLGIMLEVKAPGWGPGAIAVVALTVFFFGHQVARLAGWEDVALCALGLVLLAVEIFVLPGFGVAGIFGILFLGTGLLLAMIGRDWELALAAGTLRAAVLTLSSSVVATAAVFVGLVRLLPQSRFARKGLFLHATLGTSLPSAMEHASPHVGRAGVVHSVLRPAGSVVVDGARLDAVSDGEVIPAGAPVMVVGVRGDSVVVRAT